MTPNEAEELKVQENIIKHVDDFESFRFNAGAGAGKTYALIETLKYVTINKITATNSSQKVACITYTNVAVSEIKSRLGNSEKVHVSTIHEKLWDIIKRYQSQLLICHASKIEGVIENNNQILLRSCKAKFFNQLDEQQQQQFIELAYQTKDVFYRSKKLNAKNFRNAYTDNIEIHASKFLKKCLKSVGDFKYVVGMLYENQRLELCLKRIHAGEEQRVKYDSKINSDRLHYMKFSHDTLLEYGLKLVENYPILCRIIIDSYPYFFIDEYQDTDSNVVRFVRTIHDYAIENKKDWMVGYFGDTAQNIYDNGVGRKITDIHDRLANVDKIFNRRSHQQIIDVANNIRADEIVQKPIFDERNTGSVRFSYNSSESKLITAQNFLTDYKRQLISNGEEGKIHCLVLTNKLMASFNGFGDVYEMYQKSVIYYDNLNAQVLSQQLEKLHPTVLTIYHFVKLYQDIQQGMVSYYSVFGESSKNLPFSKASLLIRELKSNGIVFFKDWVNLIIERLGSSSVKEVLGEVIINRVHYEQKEVASADVFQSVLLGSINSLMNEDSECEDNAKEKLDDFLKLPISSLKNWASFIDGIETGEFSYHTYHGVKGEEYKNVAIILEHSFGRMNKDKFKNFFNIVQQDAEERERLLALPETKEKHVNTQNLLYVACSRAIKNLSVLYLDDVSEIEDGIKAIFGECKPWPVDGA